MRTSNITRQGRRDTETGEPDDAISIKSGSEGGWEKRPAMDLARSLPNLQAIGLPAAFATAADDNSWDAELDAETALALSRTGRDVGTPIITFEPPDGVSFFGPVISRIPSDEEAVMLWNAVLTLAKFPGFAEIKRSLREAPQLRILGNLHDN